MMGELVSCRIVAAVCALRVRVMFERRSCVKSNGKFHDLLRDATCSDIFLPILFYSNIVA